MLTGSYHALEMNTQSIALLVNHRHWTTKKYVLISCVHLYYGIPTAISGMGARRGGRQGGTCPTLEFAKMTSYSVALQNTLKFSLVPSALAIDTLYFSLKRRKKRKIFRLRPGRAEKMVHFWYGTPKTCQIVKVSVVLPPSGKFSAGAHDLWLKYASTVLRSCGERVYRSHCECTVYVWIGMWPACVAMITGVRCEHVAE